MLGLFVFFFFNDTATTEIYTLSLHDALPIFGRAAAAHRHRARAHSQCPDPDSGRAHEDRKSTRLNSSHSQISYAVFCLKKKNTTRSIILVPPAFPRLYVFRRGSTTRLHTLRL